METLQITTFEKWLLELKWSNNVKDSVKNQT